MSNTPWEVKEQDGKHCVFKKGGDTPIKGGCHATRNDALKHQRALYAAEPTPTMKYSVLAYNDDALTDTEEENIKWVKAWRYSSWEHPKYGLVEITPSTGMRMSQHFHNGSLGREHIVNFDHGLDPAKGGQAGGTILDIEPRDDGIYYKVEFHDDTLKEIRAKKWRYLSPEFDDFFNPETGEIFEDMPFDLAVTNTPFFKGMPALNFSEVAALEAAPHNPKDNPKGGKAVDELLKKFAAELGLELSDDMDEAAVVKAASTLNETIEPLRRAKSEGARQRIFRESFPEQYKEMQELKSARIESEAMSFAESYARFTLTDGDNTWKSAYGFSQLVIDEIADTHKKFAERTATHADLKKLLDLIGDRGIVDYSEHGSTRTAEGKVFSEDPKQAFHEAITAAMTEDNLTYEAAMEVAKIKHPDMYDAYLRAVPQR